MVDPARDGRMKLDRPARRPAALLLCALLAIGAAAGPAWASRAASAEIRAALPDARVQGQGEMRFFGLEVYAATLWTVAEVPPDRFASDPYAYPFALELRYARSLKGEAISERSIAEMQRTQGLTPQQAVAWLALMKQVFPDVQEGDRITGVYTPGQGARFVYNGTPLRDIDDGAFARAFFGIWLSPKTSAPALRQALLFGSAV